MLEVLWFLLVLFFNIIVFAGQAFISLLVVGACAALLSGIVIFADMIIDKAFRKKVATKIQSILNQL